MSPHPNDPDDLDAPATPDRIASALLYLLVQMCTRGACCNKVLAIGQHLEMLAAHPDTGAELRTVSLQLRDHWLRCCAEAQANVAAESVTSAVIH
jgi:hypothetical protein